MKKLLKMMIAVALLVIVTTGCSNEELLENVSSVEAQGVNNIQPKEIYRFKYKGIQYAAEYETKDSTIVFNDPFLANMVHKLNENPNTATLIYPDGIVEYFDSNKELDELIEVENTSESSAASTRANGFSSITLTVYEDADFKGRELTYNGPVSVPDMRNANNSLNIMSAINFDDIITSFKLKGNFVSYAPGLPTPPGLHPAAIVTFYKDPNYKSGSVSFKIDVNKKETSHNYFKKIGFNDRVSSLRLSWAN